MDQSGQVLEGADTLLQKTSRCVACGLCVPGCPTYALTANEAASPRGRILLAEGLAQGRLAPDVALRAYLDSCLSCRACEAACPNAVPYGEIISWARGKTRTRNLLRAFLLFLLSRSFFAYLGLWLLAALQKLKVFTLLRKWKMKEAFLVPESLSPLPFLRPRQGSGQEVELFLGCISRAFDRKALLGAAEVFSRLGFSVRLPRGQGCCGAMHRHAGEDASRFAKKNMLAFSGEKPILTVASGCGAGLKEAFLASGEKKRASQVTDALAYLGRMKKTLPAVHVPALIHLPCTLNNVLRQEKEALAFLGEVFPKAKAVRAPVACCGGAGLAMLWQPEMTRRLRDLTLDAFEKEGVPLVFTFNVGCALFLQAGARERKMPLQITHPLAYLGERKNVEE